MNSNKLIRVQTGARPPDSLLSHILAKVDEQLATIPKISKLYWPEKRKLLRKAKQEYFRSWRASHPYLLTTKRDPSNLIPDSAEMIGDLRCPDNITRLLRQCYATAYHIVSHHGFTPNFRLRHDIDISKALIQIAGKSTARDIVYYPDEGPVETVCATGRTCQCPYYKLDLLRYVSFLRLPDVSNNGSMNKRYVPVHIHKCTRQTYQRPGSQWTPEYCYCCNTWFGESTEFETYCQNQFLELDHFCGLV